MIKKILSLLLSATLVWTSGGVLDAALAAPDVFAGPSDLPQFQLQPPGRLGRVADYFNAERDITTARYGTTRLRTAQHLWSF